MSVGAVNKSTGERIPTAGLPAVDSVLSGISTNPVQNRVVKEALDRKADTDMVAADFNAETSYTAGNYCVQDGKLYKFKNNHSGAWSAADVDEVKITGELSALKSGLINYETQNDLNLEVPNRKNLFIGIYGANSTTVYSPVKPSTKYTISTKSTGASQINMQYIYTDDTIGGNAALCPSGATSNSITVTTPSNAKGIEIYAVADASAQSYASETQIELGSTATAYAPYIPSVESRIEAVESGLTNLNNRSYYITTWVEFNYYNAGQLSGTYTVPTLPTGWSYRIVSVSNIFPNSDLGVKLSGKYLHNPTNREIRAVGTSFEATDTINILVLFEIYKV